MTTHVFDPMGHDTPIRDRNALVKLAKGHHFCGTAVEIGAWAGQTTMLLAAMYSRVFAIDTWEGSPWEEVGRSRRLEYPPRKAFQTFCRNMGEHLFDVVFPCVGHSLSYAPVWNHGIELLFLDGDHRYESVKADLLAWVPHVIKGGIIAIHDFENPAFPGVTRAVQELLPGFQRTGLTLVYVHRDAATDTRIAEQAAFTAGDFWPAARGEECGP